MKAIPNRTKSDIGVAVATEFFAKLGWLFREQSKHDIGIDAHVEIVESGFSTGQLIGIQIKTGRYFKNKDRDLTLYISERHRSYWLNYSIPVIIFLYEVDLEKAFWQFIDIDTIKPTGRGGYKISIPISKQISIEFAREISEQYLDDFPKLVVMAWQKWTNHGLLPELAELYYFAQKLEQNSISNKLITFILCSTYSRLEEVDAWIETNAHFSMVHLFYHLLSGNEKFNSQSYPNSDLNDLASGVYADDKARFVCCTLFNKKGIGLQIYIISMLKPEIVYRPIHSREAPKAWRIFDECIDHLHHERIKAFQNLINEA